jgi:amidase
MVGYSDRDEITWKISLNPISDFTAFGKGTDLTGLAIGVPRNTFKHDPASPLMISFEEALQTLTAAGTRIVDNADFPKADEFKKLNQQIKGIVCSSEFRRDIVRYLGTLKTNPNNITSAEDIIEFTKTHPEEEYPDRDIGKFLWTQAEGIDGESEKYKHMLEQESFFGGEGGILGALENFGVDVLVVPSMDGMALDLAAKMGFPELSVPLGFLPEGTPIIRDSDKSHLIKVAPGIP